MVSYLQRKYEGEKLTLTIALGSPALKFLLDHESVLFPGVPRIYSFHAESEETARRLWPRVTGVRAGTELNKTLDIAFALHPDTQRVVVVSGSSNQTDSTGRKPRQRFASIKRRCRSPFSRI